MRRSKNWIAFLSFAIFSICGRSLSAQGAAATVAVPETAAPPSVTRPGRDPSQPIDEEYTKKIREYTTDKAFTTEIPTP